MDAVYWPECPDRPPRSTDVVYNALHRVVGRRVATDPRWSCVTYDTRGRAVSSTDSSAKTATTTIVGTDYLTTYVDSASAPRATGGAPEEAGTSRAAGADGSSLGYQGALADAETKKVILGPRQYDPTTDLVVGLLEFGDHPGDDHAHHVAQDGRVGFCPANPATRSASFAVGVPRSDR